MKHIALISLLFACLAAGPARATEMYNVEYLCADWGPAMTLPSKPDEKPQFSKTEEEIYFIKQLGSYTKNLGENEGHGVNIYLCKMKPDGGSKTEIKELWHDVKYPIDTQTQSTWMDLNVSTGKIALSVIFAGSDIVGIWTMNCDGSELRRILPPTMVDGHLESVGSPSWTPDGHWIVFDESLRGLNRSWIAKCDKDGKNLINLTDGPADGQPRVSPDGKQVVYVRDPRKKLETSPGHERWAAWTLWLMDTDGTNKHEIPNPNAKPYSATKGVWGTYPAWSPDGTKIYALSAGIIDAGSGKKLNVDRPTFEGKPWTAEMVHWGNLGLLGSATSFRITLTDPALKRVKALTLSGESETRDTPESSSKKE